MKTYSTPTTKMLHFMTRPVMLEISVKFNEPIENPDDENAGLVNHYSVWDEE